MYFLFRCLVRTWEDVDRVVLGFIVISVPVAIFFLIERSTGRNLFAMFGGVPLITDIRDGPCVARERSLTQSSPGVSGRLCYR